VIVGLAGVDSKYITVEVVGQIANTCCLRYKVVIADEKNNSSNVEQIQAQVTAALSSAPDWTLESGTNGPTSNGNTNNGNTSNGNTKIPATSETITPATSAGTSLIVFTTALLAAFVFLL